MPPAATKPLEPLSREETVLKHMQKHFNRQIEETFAPVEQFSPEGWFFVDLKSYCNMNLFSAAGRTCPVRFPFIDLAECSAGGGTIAWADEAGALNVGPISAGAIPWLFFGA